MEQNMKMKNYKNIILPIAYLIGIGLAAGLIYKKFFKQEQPQLYTPGKAIKKTIRQEIKASGYLEVTNLLKIGSLVPGVIKKMMVEENDEVKKGQLIATIDDGKDDTEVREAKADWQKARAELTYQKEFYQRQKTLYANNHISKDDYQKALRDIESAQALVDQKKATYDFAVITYNNKEIKAPANGTVIEKVSTEGETVTLASPATIIYTIANDIRQMKAKLVIDESVIAGIKKGSTAFLTYDTYPYKLFKGTIDVISNAPIKQGGAVSYLATIPIDNSQLLFRPGMTVDATILIAQKENVVAVPSNIFKINKSLLKEIAQQMNITFNPLSPEEKHKLALKGNIKTVWIKENNSFVEKAIEIGATDNAFFEIISGLTCNEDIIVDVVEPDVMKEMFQRFFGKGLSK